MGFLAIMLAYTIRTSLSLSITKMVVSHGHSASAEECVVEGNDNPGTNVSWQWEEHYTLVSWLFSNIETRRWVRLVGTITRSYFGVVLHWVCNHSCAWWGSCVAIWWKDYTSCRYDCCCILHTHHTSVCPGWWRSGSNYPTNYYRSWWRTHFSIL